MPTRTISFTVDVEDHHAGLAGPSRYQAATRRLAEFLAAHGIRGTFFVVGDLAGEAAGLIRTLAEAGHEIGCHGAHHRPLAAEDPARLGQALAAAKARLEQAAGQPVAGFRAPYFSLTPASRWAVGALAAAGFAYSSSVLPGRGPGHGFPGAPRTPFLWPEGLLEIPCPVLRLGPFALPLLGGTTMRYLPPWDFAWMRRAVARQGARERGGEPALWTYCHPYDIDTGEPFARLPGLSLASSVALWANRGATLRRWRTLAQNPAPPLAERAGTLRAAAAPWRP